jgi:ABC-type branched-subunit amino acid transport system permease subunit
MDPIVLYIATLVFFWFVYNIQTWGLNIQFGYTGLLDFAYIVFFAAGAYFTAASVLGAPPIGMSYILGFGWPFVASLLLGAVVAGLMGLLLGLVVLRRLRMDYLAIVTISLGTIAYDVVSNEAQLFNSYTGLLNVPPPYNDVLQLDPGVYLVVYTAATGAVMLAMWFVANRIYNSPFGRALRAIREDVDVAGAYGKHTYVMRMTAMVVGCVFAGIAGALVVGFIGAINPAGWNTSETFLVWCAMLVGGRANNLGSVVGSLLVPVVFIEATRYLPDIPGHPELILAGRNIIIGALLIAVVMFRPAGLLPERKRRFYEIPLRTKPMEATSSVNID